MQPLSIGCHLIKRVATKCKVSSGGVRILMMTGVNGTIRRGSEEGTNGGASGFSSWARWPGRDKEMRLEI